MMNCPVCAREITKLAQRCGGCGADFGPELHEKFAFYFGLKDELEKLTHLQNSLFAGIAHVTARMERYEVVLRSDLTCIASAARPAAKQSPRKKKKR